MELAKCEEDEDQLEYALTHLQKALEMDDSGQYRDRLTTALTRLKLRATLYQTPERPEDLAAMIIEQVLSKIVIHLIINCIVHLSMHSIILVHSFIYLFIHLFIHFFIYLLYFIHLFIHLFLY